MGNDYDTSELRRRQRATGDSGATNEEFEFSVLEGGDRVTLSVDRRESLKPMIVALCALALGFLLALVGPVPGLGVFIIIGAALAVPLIALQAWLGG
jgi:hypothetical protein